jgi:hypothetical protein
MWQNSFATLYQPFAAKYLCLLSVASVVLPMELGILIAKLWNKNHVYNTSKNVSIYDLKLCPFAYCFDRNKYLLLQVDVDISKPMTQRNNGTGVLSLKKETYRNIN